jgi:integrase
LGTLGAVIAAYYERGPGTELKAGKAARALIERVFVDHLSRPSLEVTMPELQLLIDGWRSKSSGLHCAAYFRPVARWAAKRGLMVKADALEAPARSSGPKQRVLTREEVPRLLRELNLRPHDAAARFMLLTAARCSEVCDATWDEIDLAKRIWTIPGSRRKNTRRRRANADHVVPLSRQATALLGQLNTGAPDELVFVGERGARLTNWPRWSARLERRLGFEVSPHALRRTCATFAGDLGFAPHVISALLGHRAIGGSLIAGYNQSRFTREVADALQQIGDLLASLAAGQDNIVALNGARRA